MVYKRQKKGKLNEINKKNIYICMCMRYVCEKNESKNESKDKGDVLNGCKNVLGDIFVMGANK